MPFSPVAAYLTACLLGGRALAAPVIEGQEEEGFPSVVALGASFGGYTLSACTGNMITPRIVLSAGHCGEGVPLETVIAIGQAFFGSDIEAPDAAIGFEDMILHPDYVELSGINLPENDIGLLFLAEDAPVEPSFFWKEELHSDDIGRALKSVGFGVSDASGGGSGIKRSADLTLDDLREQFMVSYVTKDGTTICSGDSGGPQFIDVNGTWVEAGVHSWADTACSTYSGSTRTDMMAEWILEQVAAYHGTDDMCEINGWYDDGVCHELCDQEDGDCFVDTGGPDTGDYDTGAGAEQDAADEEPAACGCAAGRGAGALPAVGLALLCLGAARCRRDQV